jgi:hypothetical protein
MRAVRVLTGEYAHLPDPVGGPRPWATCPDVVAAVTVVVAELADLPAARLG